MMEKITCRIGESQGKNGKQQKALEKASTVVVERESQGYLSEYADEPI